MVSTVDLPQPEWPISEMNSPRFISRSKPSTTVSGPFGGRVDLLHFVELDVAIDDAGLRAGGLGPGLGQLAGLLGLGEGGLDPGDVLAEMDRNDVGQTAAVVLAAVLLHAHVHEILGDLGAQALELGIVVGGGAVARARQVDHELAVERRAGAEGSAG